MYLIGCESLMCRYLKIISILMMGWIRILKNNKKVMYISGYSLNHM